MLILSKGIKWLVVFSTGCCLASTASAPHAPRNAEHETIAIEAGHEQAPFPVFGINDLMQMLAR